MVSVYFDIDAKIYKELVNMKDRSRQLSNERKNNVLSAANKTVSFFYSLPDFSSDESLVSSSSQIVAKSAFKLSKQKANTLGYLLDPLPLGAGSSFTERKKMLENDLEQYVLLVLPLCLPDNKYYPKTYKLNSKN